MRRNLQHGVSQPPAVQPDDDDLGISQPGARGLGAVHRNCSGGNWNCVIGNGPAGIDDHGFWRRVRPVWVLLVLLSLQTGLLSWIAFANSPVVDELGHLPAGLSHWRFQRFDLYRVNPPLVRSVAAIPVLFSGCVEDWSQYRSEPLEREEFRVGRAFVSANGRSFFHHVSLARLACIPFSLLGSIVCCRWAEEISGRTAGLFAAALWIVSPNLLAHGALLTPDVGAAAMGLLAAYTFWRWLRAPTWKHTLQAGIALGLSQLTKSTWLMLFGLWPVIFLFSVFTASSERSAAASTGTAFPGFHALRQGGRLCVLLACGLYILNLGYLFEGSLTALGTYQFRSGTLSGVPVSHDGSMQVGNRFVDTMFGSVPVPLPSSYVTGLDLQKLDFERGQPSYRCGKWHDQGCWWYYLYGLAVKVPLSTQLMAGLALAIAFRRLIRGRRQSVGKLRSSILSSDKLLLILVLFGPPGLVLLLTGLQTGLNKHLRYVLPVLPFAFVAIAAVAGYVRSVDGKPLRSVFAALLLWTTVSSLRNVPHSLAYFNELVGGPQNGHRHLLDSNLDWGQSLLDLERWNNNRTDRLPLYVAYSGLFDPADVHLNCQPVPTANAPLPAGWYAISINRLYGYEAVPEIFRTTQPDTVLHHAMAIFKLPRTMGN